MKKREIRIQVLEALYEMEFQKEPKNPSEEVMGIVQSILNHKEKIDQILEEHSKNWKLSRMALLDVNILRIAIYEMIFSKTKDSSKIFINEAIEIAKSYSSSDSYQFINGILDSIAKKEVMSNV